MTRFDQQFKLHSVGQGLCYSGFVTDYHHQFRMVFDCGSLNTKAIDREVALIRAGGLEESGVLDLLVISHFDADHVSHILKLVENVRTVRRLVLPFLGFTERLFMVLKGINTTGGYNPGYNDVIRMVIDPVGSLGDRLNGDSEVYFVESDPDPIPPDRNSDDFSRRERESDDNQGFVFDFENKRDLSPEMRAELRVGQTRASLFQTQDSNKGIMSKTDMRLMDFLFYKRRIGDRETLFYSTVEALLYDNYKITSPTVENVISVIKEFKNAKPVRKLFRDAAIRCRLPIAPTTNLNTTALCMLHRNLLDIIYLVSGHGHLPKDNWSYFDRFPSIRNTYNFKGFPNQLSSERCYYVSDVLYGGGSVGAFFRYPNTMLTSDTFLFSAEDIAAFQNKYRNYRDHYWLVQVPHHGSAHSVNADFFIGLNLKFLIPEFFINYGLNNRFGHPKLQVIQMLSASSGNRVFPVHELQGLEFSLTLTPH